MATQSVLSHAQCSTTPSVSASIWQHDVFYYLLDAQLFLQSYLVTGNKQFYRMLDVQIFLRSQLISGNTICFFHMFDAQLILQSQLVPGNTLCCITCWMLRCLPGLSA